MSGSDQLSMLRFGKRLSSNTISCPDISYRAALGERQLTLHPLHRLISSLLATVFWHSKQCGIVVVVGQDSSDNTIVEIFWQIRYGSNTYIRISEVCISCSLQSYRQMTDGRASAGVLGPAFEKLEPPKQMISLCSRSAAGWLQYKDIVRNIRRRSIASIQLDASRPLLPSRKAFGSQQRVHNIEQSVMTATIQRYS